MPSFGYSFQYFNPLPRKEGDLDRNNEVNGDNKISIHSLVKRETNVTVTF